MNLEDSFHRIRVVILLVAVLLGAIAALLMGHLSIGVLSAVVSLVVLYALWYIGFYLADGFMQKAMKSRTKLKSL